MDQYPSRAQNISHSAARAQFRRGFTLVEMLVVISIMIILASITIGAFQATKDDDRLAAGAQQIKSSIEGARSRALDDKAPRGVRFLRDPNNPTLCLALEYIGTATNDEGFVDLSLGINKSVSYFSVYDDDGTPTDLGNMSDDTATPTVFNCIAPIAPNSANPVTETASSWQQLYTQGLLVAGRRIQVPKGSGKWYTISSVGILNPGAAASAKIPAIGLSEPLEGDTQEVLGSTIGFKFGLDYSLELAPAPLPGSEPIGLPIGVALDLDASQLPSVWRPADNNMDGAITGDAANPTPNEYPAVDLMFSPTGKLLGAPAAAGMIHFYLGSMDEIDLYMASQWSPNNPSTGRPITGTRIPDIPGGANAPQKPSRIVTVLTGSGQTYSSDIDFTGVSTADKLKLAKRGEEAGR